MAISVSLTVLAGKTDPSSCRLDDPRQLLEPLRAGDVRSVSLSCIDKYGNRADSGSDTFELELSGGVLHICACALAHMHTHAAYTSEPVRNNPRTSPYRPDRCVP